METEKIDAIGESLDVKISDFKHPRKQIFSRVTYAIVQGFVVLTSWLVGNSEGVNGIGGYPFWNPLSRKFVPALLVTTAVHVGNGIFIIPKGTQLLPIRSQRIIIFFGNLLLSFTLFFLTTIHPYPPNITLYGVFNNNIDRKNKPNNNS
ncbi:MAG: hypothetical protein RBG13Loki_2065 [Promethearchaeota archaeon CR_4]|nr:MAG: hypothetical protein RBG13Loki_2065 [Candidatus Lokiarchaeota archaeon CR_4]